MRRITSFCLMLIFVMATAGCVTAQPAVSLPAPVRLDELVALSTQGLSDDALIAQIEQRGVAFVLSPRDFEAQRAAGVSEGVLRYLQGRAIGDQNVKASILAGSYPIRSYSGPAYLGYPYLGYYGGLHYYGARHHYGAGRPGGRHGGHAGAHHGGGHHGGGHHGGGGGGHH